MRRQYRLYPAIPPRVSVTAAPAEMSPTTTGSCASGGSCGKDELDDAGEGADAVVVDEEANGL